MFLFGVFRRPTTRVTTTTTTNTNGVVRTTTSTTNNFANTLRYKFGYTSVSTSTKFSTTKTRGQVWQAPPTANNPAPPSNPQIQQGLRTSSGNFAQAYVQPPVPKTTTSSTTTTTTTTTTYRPVKPRFRLVPVGFGLWVWRRY